MIELTDLNGNTLNRYDYDAIGNVTSKTETVKNSFTYRGYWYDGDTGNFYLFARDYNPQDARFLTEDRYAGELNDPLSLNYYAYVNNIAA